MARPKPNLTPEQLKARQAQWVQNWRTKYPEKQKLARKRAYNNRKLKALKMVGDAECVRCGCDELDFLEFNHTEGGGCKDWRKNKGVAMMDRVIGGRDTEDLEILCRICNALHYLESKNNKQALRYDIYWE
jgi:hypothetical protein